MDVAHQTSAKEAVGVHAAQLVQNGMNVGLGYRLYYGVMPFKNWAAVCGKRAWYIKGVPTSFAAERLGA